MFDFTELASSLKEMGVTLGLLSVVALGMTILFILAAREFALWFFKLNSLVKSQKEILNRLDQLEDKVAASPTSAENAPTQFPLASEKEERPFALNQ